MPNARIFSGVPGTIQAQPGNAEPAKIPFQGKGGKGAVARAGRRLLAALLLRQAQQERSLLVEAAKLKQEIRRRSFLKELERAEVERLQRQWRNGVYAVLVSEL